MNIAKTILGTLVMMLMCSPHLSAGENPYEIKVWGMYIISDDVESQPGKFGLSEANIRLKGAFKRRDSSL